MDAILQQGHDGFRQDCKVGLTTFFLGCQAGQHHVVGNAAFNKLRVEFFGLRDIALHQAHQYGFTVSARPANVRKGDPDDTREQADGQCGGGLDVLAGIAAQDHQSDRRRGKGGQPGDAIDTDDRRPGCQHAFDVSVADVQPGKAGEKRPPQPFAECPARRPYGSRQQDGSGFWMHAIA